MATYDSDRKVSSYAAGSALTSHQWNIVSFNTSELVMVADDADDEAEPILGILENKPAAANAPCLVCTSGKSKVVAACAITAGAAITNHTNGRGTPTTTVGDHIIGFALADCTAAGEMVPIQVSIGYHPGTS